MPCKTLALGATALALAVGGRAAADDITLTTTVTQLPAAVDAGAGNTYRVTGAADAATPTGVMMLGEGGLGGVTSIGFAGALSGTGLVQIYFQQGNGGSGSNPAPTETVDLTAADFSAFTGQLMVCNSWNNNALVKLGGDLSTVTYLFGGVSRARGFDILRGYDAADRGADTLQLADGTVRLAGIVGAPKGAGYDKVSNVNGRELVVPAASYQTSLVLTGAGDYAFYGTVGANNKRLTLNKTGTGTQVLGGANWFNNFRVSEGTLTVGAGTVSDSLAVQNDARLIIDGMTAGTTGLTVTGSSFSLADPANVIFNFAAPVRGENLGIALIRHAGVSADGFTAANITVNGEPLDPRTEVTFAVVDDALLLTSCLMPVDVVRVHPWLTRGAGEEAILGFRGLVGAAGAHPVQLAVRFTFTNCTAADFNCFRFFTQPNSVQVSGAESSAGTAYTLEVAHHGAPNQTGSNSLWYHRPQTADSTYTVNITNNGNADSRINMTAGASLWVVVEPKTTISPDASFTAEVVGDVTVNGLTYPVNDPDALRPYRVNPFRHRIGAYIKANTFPFYDSNAKEERLGSLTEILCIPDGEQWCDVRQVGDGYQLVASEKFRTAFARLRALCDDYNRTHPGACLRLKLSSPDHPANLSNGTPLPLSTAMNDVHRAGLVASIVKLMDELQADGFDVDWEYCMTAEQFQNYTKTMSALKDHFFHYGWEFSEAVNGNYKWLPKAACALGDYLNVMAYGGSNSFGQNASLKVLRSHANRFAETLNVPKRRLVIGQAIYSDRSSHPGWASLVSSPTFTGIDCDACTLNGSAQSFTGPVTYRAKVRYCLDEGYGGVMSWGYYTDANWTWWPTLSLGRAQAQVIWPERDWDWPEPEKDGDTYVLRNETDWFWFADHADSVVKARLGNDITFARDPKPVPSFSGELDGDGHTLTIPELVWIVTYDNVGLFNALNGTVKNLTIDLAGKIISRRDRKNDGGSESGDACAGVLAANLNGGATVENVRVVMRPSSEVRAPHEVGALAGQLYTAEAALTVRDVTVDIAGKLSTWTANSAGDEITMGNGRVGGLVGQFNWKAANNPQVAFTDCTAILREGAVLEARSGNHCTVGGAIGNLHVKPEGQISGLDVVLYPGVSLTCTREGSFFRQPYVGSFLPNNTKQNALPLAQGSLMVLDEDFPWTLATLWVREEDALPETFSPVAFTAGSGADEQVIAGAMRRDLIGKLPVTPSRATRKIVFDSVANAEAVYCFGNVKPEVVAPAQPENARLKFAFGAEDAAADTDTLTLTARWTFGINEVRLEDGQLVLEAAARTGDGTPATFAAGTAAKLLVREPASGDFVATDCEAVQPDGRVGVRRFTVPLVTGDSAAHLYKASVSRPSSAEGE